MSAATVKIPDASAEARTLAGKLRLSTPEELGSMPDTLLATAMETASLAEQAVVFAYVAAVRRAMTASDTSAALALRTYFDEREKRERPRTQGRNAERPLQPIAQAPQATTQEQLTRRPRSESFAEKQKQRTTSPERGRLNDRYRPDQRFG
jgi:hypothetical protein